MSYYSEKYEIMLHDVDANNNARPSTIARLLQETANHQMRDRGPSYHELFNQGKSYILIRFSAQIHEPLVPYQEVEVRTWVCPSKGATFKRNYSIYDGVNRIVEAASEWAVVDNTSGKIYSVKDIDTDNYEEDDPIELTIPVRFRIPDDQLLEYSGNKVVGYSDCDMNLHMNNTRYQDMLWEQIPGVENKQLTGFSLRFMASGSLGSKIEIHRGRSNSAIPDGAGGKESWYFRTFIDDKTNVECLMNFRDLG